MELATAAVGIAAALLMAAAWAPDPPPASPYVRDNEVTTDWDGVLPIEGLTFTFDEPDWILVGFNGPDEAVIGSDFGYNSPPNALALSGNDTEPIGGQAYRDGLTLTPGKEYAVRAWFNADEAKPDNPVWLAIVPHDFDGSVIYADWYVNKSQVPPGGGIVDLGTFTPPPIVDPSTYRIGVALQTIFLPVPINVDGRWVIDDIQFGEPVAGFDWNPDQHPPTSWSP